jgi:hypothetical protein
MQRRPPVVLRHHRDIGGDFSAASSQASTVLPISTGPCLPWDGCLRRFQPPSLYYFYFLY